MRVTSSGKQRNEAAEEINGTADGGSPPRGGEQSVLGPTVSEVRRSSRGTARNEKRRWIESALVYVYCDDSLQMRYANVLLPSAG